MQLNEELIDIRITDTCRILYGPVKANRLIGLLVKLHDTQMYTEVEDVLIAIISDTDIDNDEIMQLLENNITNACIGYLRDKGIGVIDVTIPMLDEILDSLIAFSRMSQTDGNLTLSILSDEDDDDVLILCKIIEQYSSINYLELYDVITYVKPSLLKKIKNAVEHLLEGDDSVIHSFDKHIDNSYIYTKFINDKTTVLTYDVLLVEFFKYMELVPVVDQLARELYVVIKFSKNIENFTYFVTHDLKDDLYDYTEGLDSRVLVDDILTLTLTYLRNDND